MLTNTTNTLTIKDKGFFLKSLIRNKFFVLGLKGILAITLLIILYHQIFNREDLTIQSLGQEFMTKISWQSLPWLLLVLVLMPLNWFFETQKWLALMRKIEPIALKEALRVVLVGLTFSLFTPNRVGEYGGRVMMVSKEKRFMSVYATMVGISSQWIVLVVGGWWALMFAFYWAFIPSSSLLFASLLSIGGLATIVLLVIYFNLRRLIDYCLRFKWTEKWAQKIKKSLFQYYTKRELWGALGYSMVRYFIYSFQYLCLLYFFGFEANVLATFLGILIVFLLQTGIPLPPSTGLLARGNIALLVFGYLSVAHNAPTIILASTFSLWMINVILPALIGAVFIAKLGWDKKEENIESNSEIPCSI